MANKSGKKGSLVPKWFRHRWLVEAEAILVVGVVQELLQHQIANQGLPRWAQTLWIMGCTLGLLGGVLLVFRLVARHSVAKAHQTARLMPVPLPVFVLHLAAFAGLFVLYAHVWGLWPL